MADKARMAARSAVAGEGVVNDLGVGWKRGGRLVACVLSRNNRQ